MQDIISEDTAWLELRVPENAVGEDDFVQMCAHLDATGYALQTDVKAATGEHVAWFATGPDIRETRARIAAAAMLLGIQNKHITLAELGGDWATAWQRDWHGMPVGNRLWVRPSFCEAAPGGRIDIVLDPGMAFGTGQHATTQLCLKAIERICRQGKVKNMLDMGAGSGLLAIAAGKLGVQNIMAIDNDPLSVEASHVNSTLNGIALDTRLADRPPDQCFELVVANILAAPLLEMASGLAACSSGVLVLSGLLATQVEQLRNKYEAVGMRHVRTDTQNEWASMEWIS